ncbi:subtilisin-like protein [Lactarius psammicola]|nr:subtilisin-like protein [Lactarius psammicola]
MRYSHLLSVLSVLAAARLADLAAPLAPLWDDMRLMHTWDTVPDNWESLGRPPAGTTINLHIALKAQHENALIDALYKVSDPYHQNYGAHLSREQVASLVAPHPETLGLVNSWLKHHGVSSSISMTHGDGWLTVTGVPVSQADNLLGASYRLYRHIGTNRTIIRTVSYALPALLHAHVQTVAPTTHFAPPRMLHQTTHKRFREKAAATANATSGEFVTVLSTRDGEIVPEDLRELYKTTAYEPTAMGRNKLAIADYGDESPSQQDLTTFMSYYRTDATDVTFELVQVNGGLYNPSHPDIEGSVTMQYAAAIAYPTPFIFYSVGGEFKWSPDTNEPIQGDTYLEWLRYVLTQPIIPLTISISYGNMERDFPPAYAKALCDLFARLGARGVSVLFASGDHGVGQGDCKDSSGKVQFTPLFPASCPFVTSVGGTTGLEEEVAAGISGGGFSFYFPREKYQDNAVGAFLGNLGSKYDGLYNPHGRGIPDISAQALKYLIVVKLGDYMTAGTSCSTPTVAGVISLLNDYLLANGKTPLGFLNPWLYSFGLPGLNDITSGSNPGCGTEGFSAINGWDPVTGLGTPDFEKLQKILIPTAPPNR